MKNQQLSINNKTLYINHYEMKQQRDLQNEANKDKQDWQRYTTENMQQPDFHSYEQISTILRLLMSQVNNKNITPVPGVRSNSAGPHMGGQGFNNQGHQGGYNAQGQQRVHQRGPQNFRGNQNHNIGGGRGQDRGMQQPLVQMNQGHQGAMPPPPMPAPPMPPAMGGNASIQVVPSNDPRSQDFYGKTLPIYNAINEINPNYKNIVGTHIFQFVSEIGGPALAPKVTGMLIDLPVHEIQRYCTNYDQFVQRITQAKQMLESPQ